VDTVKSNAEAYIVCARTSTKPPKGRRRRNSQSRSSVPCVLERKEKKMSSKVTFLSSFFLQNSRGGRSFVVAEESFVSKKTREPLRTSSLSPLSLLSLLSRVLRFSPSPSRSVPISEVRHFPWTFPRTEEAFGDFDVSPKPLFCRRRP